MAKKDAIRGMERMRCRHWISAGRHVRRMCGVCGQSVVKILCIVLVLWAAPSRADEAADVRGLRWGYSVQEVKAAESNSIAYIRENSYILKEVLLGQPCTVVFKFRKDKLDEVSYIFKSHDLPTLLRIREKITDRLDSKFKRPGPAAVASILAYNDERTHTAVAMDALPKFGGYILLVSYCSQEKFRQSLELTEKPGENQPRREDDDLGKF